MATWSNCYWLVCVMWFCLLVWSSVMAWALLQPHHTNATMFNSKVTPTFRPYEMKSFQDTNGGYYRLMVLDPNNPHIYIGAREFVYRLNRRDIRSIRSPYARSDRLTPSESQLSICKQKIVAKHTQDYQCKNHIRSIIIHTNHVYVCGTNAHEPRTYYLSKDDLSVESKGVQASGVAECPFDPDAKSTYIYIDSGNPENIASLYSATAIDYSTFDPVIYRPALKVGNEEKESFLRTVQRNDKWLKDASFIASFDMGDYVYFFLRETAVEFGINGHIVYSRVARVCKSDTGGKPPILVERWTTFVKVRLECALPGDIPFEFNEIQDVQKRGEMFYAVFTTPATVLQASAVCAFTQNSIADAFNGPFKEQASSNAFWKQARTVPDPRPGLCNRGYNEHSLIYISERPLMAHNAQPWGRQPMFYQTLVAFQQMAVDFVANYTVFFLATNRGQIHKVVHWVDRASHAQHARQLAVWTPLGSLVRPIWQLKLYDDQLYMSTDDLIAQFAIQQCNAYTTCTQCILDPYCGWDQSRHKCRKYQTGLYQDVMTKDALTFCSENNCCNTGTRVSSVRLHGDPVHLSCTSPCISPHDDIPVTWYRGEIPITIDERKHHFTAADNGLMVMNVTVLDIATYRCRSGRVLFATHVVNVTRCREPDCYFREEFRHWCTAFDAYKEQFNHWLCLKNTCTEKSCVPKSVTDTCTVV